VEEKVKAEKARWKQRLSEREGKGTKGKYKISAPDGQGATVLIRRWEQNIIGGNRRVGEEGERYSKKRRPGA